MTDNLDVLIEGKEEKLLEKKTDLENKIALLRQKRKTNGNFKNEKGEKVNIFTLNQVKKVFDLAKFINKEYELHKKTLLSLSANYDKELIDLLEDEKELIPDSLSTFLIESSFQSPVSYNDAMHDLQLALISINLKEKLDKIEYFLSSLSEKYSDGKKREKSVMDLISSMEEYI